MSIRTRLSTTVAVLGAVAITVSACSSSTNGLPLGGGGFPPGTGQSGTGQSGTGQSGSGFPSAAPTAGSGSTGGNVPGLTGNFCNDLDLNSLADLGNMSNLNQLQAYYTGLLNEAPAAIKPDMQIIVNAINQAATGTIPSNLNQIETAASHVAEYDSEHC